MILRKSGTKLHFYSSFTAVVQSMLSLSLLFQRLYNCMANTFEMYLFFNTKIKLFV